MKRHGHMEVDGASLELPWFDRLLSELYSLGASLLVASLILLVAIFLC